MQQMNTAAAESPSGLGIAPTRTDEMEAAGLSSPACHPPAGSFAQPSPATTRHVSSQKVAHVCTGHARPQRSNDSSPSDAAPSAPLAADTNATQQRSSSVGLTIKVAGFRAPSAAALLHQYKKQQQHSNNSSAISESNGGGARSLSSTSRETHLQLEQQQQQPQLKHQHKNQLQQANDSVSSSTRTDVTTCEQQHSSTSSLINRQQRQQQVSGTSSPTATASPRLRDRYAATAQTEHHRSSSKAETAGSSPLLRDKYAAAAHAQKQHGSNGRSTPAGSSPRLRDRYATAAHTQQLRITTSSKSPTPGVSSPRLRDKYAVSTQADRHQSSSSSGSLPSASSPSLREKYAGQQQRSSSGSSSPLPASSSPRVRDKYSAGGYSQQVRGSSGSSSSVPVSSTSSPRLRNVRTAEIASQAHQQNSTGSDRSSSIEPGTSSPRLLETFGKGSHSPKQQLQPPRLLQQQPLQQQTQQPSRVVTAMLTGHTGTNPPQEHQQLQVAADQPAVISLTEQCSPAAQALGSTAQAAPGVPGLSVLELPLAREDTNTASDAAGNGTPPEAAATAPIAAAGASAAATAAATAAAAACVPPRVISACLRSNDEAAAAAAAKPTQAITAEGGVVSTVVAADSFDAAAVTEHAQARPPAAAGIAVRGSETAADSCEAVAVKTVAESAPAAAAGAAEDAGALSANTAGTTAGLAGVSQDPNACIRTAVAAQNLTLVAAGAGAASAAPYDAAASNTAAGTVVVGLGTSSGCGTAFRGSAALLPQSSSDLSDASSSDISSSISGAPVDSSTHQLGLEADCSDDCGETTSLAEHQLQHQQRQQLMMQAAGHRTSAQPLEGNATQQQGEQQQQEGSGWSDASRRAAAATRTGRSRSNDPDYEVPRGKLTETQVLMSHVDKLHLDRYGFIVTEAEAHARVARLRRTPAQVKREQRHIAKWRRMLGANREEFMAYAASRPNKVKRRVRKGIPDEFRGLVWQYLSGGRELMQQHPGQYAQLLTTSNEPVDLEIMRDLNRTFPNHVFFHQRQGPGQQSLFHVLRAYSAHDHQVGYVQGMGFVTAILLMYMSEEEAFWTLVALLKGTSLHPPLEGMYQAGMPLLQQCLFQFQELLKQENPKLGMHLEQEGVVPSMYCTHWFNTMFAYSLPFEQLLRVWDVFLLEGMKMVFRVGIVLLTSSQDQLLGMPFEKLVASLNGRKFPVLEKHPDVMLKAALRIPVSRRLEQLREKYQQQVAAAEAAARASSGGGSGRSGRDTIIPVSMGPSI